MRDGRKDDKNLVLESAPATGRVTTIGGSTAMNEIRKKLQISVIAIVVPGLILCLFIFNRGVAGQQKGTSVESQLVGTWKLVGMRNENKVDVMGPHPMGMLVFDAAGNYTTQVMRSDLPKFVIPDRSKATPEESQAVIRGFMALFGTYTVSDPKTINLHVIGSMLPNWDGADQKRSFVIRGDELELTNLTNSSGDASVHAYWKRVSTRE
jgi:hypothetical protein